ncbi:hypothetical protein L6R52_43655 [Myxococcota bacterium]|nr:hypothetical protein [Myxococcota bacterium]
MKDRGLQLIAALSRGADAAPPRHADPRALRIAEHLVAAGASRPAIADAVTTWAERLAALPHERPRGWAYVTMGVAAVCAVLAAHAITSLTKLLEVPVPAWLGLAPLGALGLAALGLVVVRRVESDDAEARALLALEELTKLAIPGSVAVDAARFLAGLDDDASPCRADELRTPSDELGDRARAVLLSHRTGSAAVDRRALRYVLPALTAAWTVLSFWLLYLHVLTQHALGRGIGG